jgi:hypothetical protein
MLKCDSFKVTIAFSESSLAFIKHVIIESWIFFQIAIMALIASRTIQSLISEMHTPLAVSLSYTFPQYDCFI